MSGNVHSSLKRLKQPPSNLAPLLHLTVCFLFFLCLQIMLLLSSSLSVPFPLKSCSYLLFFSFPTFFSHSPLPVHSHYNLSSMFPYPFPVPIFQSKYSTLFFASDLGFRFPKISFPGSNSVFHSGSSPTCRIQLPRPISNFLGQI